MRSWNDSVWGALTASRHKLKALYDFTAPAVSPPTM